MSECKVDGSAIFTLVPVGELVILLSRIFAAVGCKAAEAASVSNHLVAASCSGHHSHGVIRVMRYLEWIAEDAIKVNQKATIEIDSGAIAVVDGNQGFGQTVAPFAVDLGIAKAKAFGISAVGLKRSGHLGRLGDWAERAAEASICSIHFANVNGHVLVAPFRGTERRFSTAPFSIGIPRADRPPLLLDFATALVAEGKVMVAAKGGSPLPSDALVTKDGVLSGDPQVLYGTTPNGQNPHPRRGQGAIRAFGDHKGSGLAFMCELLAGLLTGSGVTGISQNRNHLWSGMLSIFIDINRFDNDGQLDYLISDFVDYVRQTPTADGSNIVLVPGDAEEHSRALAYQEGVQVPGSVWAELQAVAKRLDVWI